MNDLINEENHQELWIIQFMENQRVVVKIFNIHQSTSTENFKHPDATFDQYMFVLSIVTFYMKSLLILCTSNTR